jgi:hypothetical protein
MHVLALALLAGCGSAADTCHNPGGCGAGGSGGSGGGGGGGGSSDRAMTVPDAAPDMASANFPQSQACIDYLSCAENYVPAQYASLEALYGPDGTCWHATAGLAASCSGACTTALAAAASDPKAPPICRSPNDMASPTSCKAILTCTQACFSNPDIIGCAMGCAMNGSPAAQQQFNALLTCLVDTCALDGSHQQIGACWSYSMNDPSECKTQAMNCQ